MRRYAIWMVTVGAALMGMSCGDSPTVAPTPAPPTTTLPTQPSPSPVPSPSPSPIAAQCTFAPGPVARLAISPRGDSFRADGAQADLFVRARPNWDEVVCLDKDKAYRLDFHANQRNADTPPRECCYEGDVAWTVLEDSDGIISSHFMRPDNEDGFIWRFLIEPKGRQGTVSIEAQLDGIKSHPWQSGSGYRREPIRIVSMSANEIARDCKCIYRGNGVYEGVGCTK